MSITPTAETATPYETAPHLGVTVAYLPQARQAGARTVWSVTEVDYEGSEAQVGIWQHASEAIEEAAAFAADTGMTYRVQQIRLR